MSKQDGTNPLDPLSRDETRLDEELARLAAESAAEVRRIVREAIRGKR